MDAEVERKAPIRILLVEDNPVFVKGLSGLLDFEEDMEVCGFAADASEALKLIAEKGPGLIIVGISLGADKGLGLVRKLSSESPRLPIIVLSMHDEFPFAKRALRAGARGYLTRQEAPELIVRAIRQVISEGEFVGDSVVRSEGD